MQKSPRQLVMQFVEAFNFGDAKRLGEVFHNSAEFVNIFGTRWSGRTAIEAGHAEAFSMRLDGTNIVARDIIYGQALETQDVQIVQLLWTLKHPGIAHAEDALVDEGDGVLTFVAARSDVTGWTFLSGANTVVSPTPGAN